MITLLSDPSHTIQVSPAIISRWLATESPNNFQLQRRDFIPNGSTPEGLSPYVLGLTFATPFTGNAGDAIACHDAITGAMLVGTVVSMASPATSILTDIPWVAGTDIDYVNDNTLYGGYYFEGRLTVNGVVQALTVIASPDSKGMANVDVSGVLRIITALGKTADYTALLASEVTKSGRFTFAYRGCWYGSAETYTEEGNTWYYAECVRSVEQGSNLHDYLASDVDDAPWLNSFERPVLFAGLPFDISFILPEITEDDVTVTIRRYNSYNMLLGTTTTIVNVAALKGRVNSLNIDTSAFEETAAYITAEIAA
jgi:hypothetical protein